MSDGVAADAPLPDGEYPAFIVDVEEDDGAVHALDLTILTGDHKGEVVRVAASGMTGSFVDLLGMPATITVAGGTPSVTVDDT